MTHEVLLDELAAALPDLPRWVAPRGLLLEHRCEILLGPEGRRTAGYLVLERGEAGAFAVNRPVASLVSQLDEMEGPARNILVPIENAEPWRTLLPGWREQAAVVHVHPSPEKLPQPIAGTRFLTLEGLAGLADEAPELRAEIERALSRGPVSAAFVEERAVAFAYAAYTTENWFDLSIETLPAYRRQGLATSAAAHLIHHQLGLGRKPVWGALDADTASMTMAQKYGFRAVDRMMVFTAPTALTA